MIWCIQRHKACFIVGLKTCMVENHGMHVLLDRDDADNLIVQTAIQASNDNGRCTIIGTDTDILEVPKSINTLPYTWYRTKSKCYVQYKKHSRQHELPFLHGISGVIRHLHCFATERRM